MNKNNKQLRLLKLTEEIDGYAIALLDSQGHIESWNKGAEKIQGYTEQIPPGTGLGLSIVRKCATLLNGSVSFRSQAGSTIFNLHFRNPI